MWLSLCILSWCCLSHSVRQIFWSRYGWKPWEQAGDWDKWAGTIALAWSARCSWASLQYANCPVYSLLVTVGLGDRITFTIAAVLPSHTHRHFHTYTHILTHSQGAVNGLSCLDEVFFFLLFFLNGRFCLHTLFVCHSGTASLSLAAFLSLSDLHPGEE